MIGRFVSWFFIVPGVMLIMAGAVFDCTATESFPEYMRRKLKL